ncbi:MULTISPECIES: hypothetical protein [unclassified Vibrio]|uniref:hypothetical protein n=1 Tax=unclassified Vibrio TaxID=2614977 RepID=UPI0018821933|nr:MULTISPECIES: hypothetical protein [unclassified Vibrio]EJX2556568.1 hypothetical protein [Vibrio alginolyticus]MBE8570743.1 hypothetical protein [Vibrio sp. OPT46]MBE8583348.1 hypothetical protein [Vibrio sp. OPT41]
MTKKYSAIYYPDSYIFSQKSLMTYLFIYDELHLVTFADDSKNPTEYFKNIPDYTTVTSMTQDGSQREFYIHGDEVTSNAAGDVNADARQVIQFYQFIHKYKSLIGESIYFHPNMIANLWSSMTEQLWNGGLPIQDLVSLLSGNNPTLLEYEKFQQEYPEVKSETLWRTVPTALNLAQDKDFILVSDKADISVPFLSENHKNVKLLTSVLAEECVKIMIPDCRQATPDEILEIRSKLKDNLLPFRMSLQKLTGDLRGALESDAKIDDLKGEAKFIVESQIEPQLYELKQAIERSNSKLMNNVFGKFLHWVPYIAKAWAMPTPENILSIAQKMGEDTNSILDTIDDFSYTKAQGLSFLLQVEEATGKK